MGPRTKAYANGLFFAFHLKTTTGEPTAEAQGMMPFFKQYSAYYRSHANLYHRLLASDAAVSVSQSRIMAAVWRQEQPRRLLVHLVNHQYDRGIRLRKEVTITLPVPTRPTAVTEASPDRDADRALLFAYSAGKLSVTLSQLTAYSVVVVDY